MGGIENQVISDFFTGTFERQSEVAYIPSGSHENLYFLKLEDKSRVHLKFRATYHTLLRRVENIEGVSKGTKFYNAWQAANNKSPKPNEAEDYYQFLLWEDKNKKLKKKNARELPLPSNLVGWSPTLPELKPVCEGAFASSMHACIFFVCIFFVSLQKASGQLSQDWEFVLRPGSSCIHANYTRRHCNGKDRRGGGCLSCV